MVKKVNNIEIEYSKEDKDLAEDIMWALEEKSRKILDFFELEKIDGLKIKIWNSHEEFKKHLLPFLIENGEEEDLEKITGHTDDGNINMLPPRFVEKIWNCKVSNEEIARDACHEFVHICQQKKSGTLGDQNTWFWEALATNLGNPESFSWLKKDYEQSIHWEEVSTINELEKGMKYKYNYLVGNYMLQRITHKRIMEYVKKPDILEKDGQKILESARKFSNNMFLNKDLKR